MLEDTTIPEPLKNGLNEVAISRLADNIQRAWPQFDKTAMVEASMVGLSELELKDRIRHVSAKLADFMPEMPEALAVIVRAVDTWDRGDPDNPVGGFAAWPMFDFIGSNGLEHFDQSMETLRRITHIFSAEFAVRPYIDRYPERAFALLETWATDEDEHVRRLCSEGCRPRLPWAPQLPALIADPTPIFPVLELLADDPELFVRRSVANNLNDIGKDHPDLLVDLCERWLKEGGKHRKWIVGHATRSLVKAGHPRVWGLLGFEADPQVEVSEIAVDPPEPRIGDSLHFTFEITSTADRSQRLAVDYAVHFMKANGKTRPKVFKLKVLSLEAGQALNLTRKLSFRPISTRKYYPGRHELEILVNGQSCSRVAFEVCP